MSNTHKVMISNLNIQANFIKLRSCVLEKSLQTIYSLLSFQELILVFYSLLLVVQGSYSSAQHYNMYISCTFFEVIRGTFPCNLQRNAR